MAAHEGMGLHDTVSYKGDCYVMERAEPDGDWPPSRVFLRSPVSLSNAKWVAWSAVRPLAIDREPLLLPRSYPTMDPKIKREQKPSNHPIICIRVLSIILNMFHLYKMEVLLYPY